MNQVLPVELGVKFTADSSGFITGIRFYKGVNNTGTHVGNLWSSTGTLLASATFTGETSSGWQQVNFASAVAITASTVYVASYFSPTGDFPVDRNYFSTAVNNPPLHGLQDGASGPNAVYNYGSSSVFPTSSYQASNYWVDVVFSTSSGGSPLSITTTSLPNGTQSVAYNQTLNATGGTTPYTWTITSGSLPASLTLSTGGVISGTPTSTGTSPFTVQVTDSSTTQQKATQSLSITIMAAAGGCPCTIWPSTATPGTADLNQVMPVELGVKFTADSSGYITGIRFYKGVNNTGTHVGNLWSSTGTLLASATFTGETSSGWEQVNFASAVAITANTVYVASYFSPTGDFSVDRNYFNTAVNNPPLHGLQNGASGPNAVYNYGSSSVFPTSSYQASNYWVDVVFSTSSGGSPLSITTTSLPNGTQSVAYNQTLNATGGTTPYTWTITSGSLPASLTLSTGGVISGTPTSTGTSPFTVQVTDSSTTQQKATQSLSITIMAAAGGCPCTIWPSTATPGTADLNQVMPVELGVKFTADSSGYITGIRFYKGLKNTGTHVGNLWSSTGTLLASATFTGETSSGWEQVNFASAVAITANTVYVASYFSPTGDFSVDWNYFNTAVNNPPLHGLQNGASGPNAVYNYGNSSAFPTSTYRASNYWVDVMFSTTLSSSTLQSISVTPANPSIPKGGTQQFTATGTYSNGSMLNLTDSATWTSLNTSVATIANEGLATGVGIGNATIQAASGGITGATTLSVTAPTLVSISVTAPNQTIAKGTNEQFTAIGAYSDNSTQNLTTSVTWNSTNTGVATITAGGLATAVGNGMTTIQATQGSVQGSLNLTVVTLSLTVLVVGPQNPVIADGGATQSFTATGHYSDGTTKDLTASATWTSSNTSVATMSGAMATSQTLVAGKSAGFTSIQAVVGTTTGVAILSVTNHTGNGFAGVFTHHNDISRTGQNTNENVLTTTNVGSTTTFGKKFSHAVDGYIYAQPLYVPNVNIGGVTHNLVIVTTEGDSVYAFDADNITGANASPLWHASLIDTAHGATAGEQTVSSSADIGCTDLVPQVGNTSTPVIDPSTGTIYVEAKSKQPTGPQFFHRLHALDITTGNEKSGGPAVIAGSVPTPSGGSVTFAPLKQHNRPGLLWLNGIIYVAFASHCDITPWYGWVFAYNAATMSQVAIWNSTLTSTSSNGGLGGIWMSGSGIAADSAANIFLPTGNGEFDTVNVPATELGDSNVKLFYNGTSTFSLLDYFTPFSQLNLEQTDTDLGSGGVLLLPDQGGTHPHELVQVGKDGVIRMIDRDQMTTGNQHYCPPTTCSSSDPEIVQELVNVVNGMWSMPTYWNNSVYFCGIGEGLRVFTLTNGMLGQRPSFLSTHAFNFPGCVPAVSANGTSNGIVWAIDASNYGPPEQTTAGPAVLYAFRGDTLAELWDSSQAASNRDVAGNAVKFSVPTVANGKVYVGTASELDVYGTLP